ncbi:hypothetical protein JHK87_055158 [Glycine soja]|nr:hypothetical protein JHK87_055158 [Glycine soja]
MTHFWVKPDKLNPVVVDKDVNHTEFRDPTAAWWGKDGHWRMLVGSVRKRRGIAYLYGSKDFMTWVRAKHPIHSKGGTGMWECPNFYPVSVIGNVVGNPVKYVLKNNLDDTKFDYYNVGTYMEDKDRYVPDNTSVDGWGGLRGGVQNYRVGVGPFGLLTLATQNLEEFTPVFFRVFKSPNKHIVLLCSDARSSSLKSDLYKPQFAVFVDVDLTVDKKISLRSLIDHSVVESFGAGGKTNILSRVYPELAVMNQAHLFVFNNGTEPIVVQNLEAWSMISTDIK